MPRVRLGEAARAEGVPADRRSGGPGAWSRPRRGPSARSGCRRRRARRGGRDRGVRAPRGRGDLQPPGRGRERVGRGRARPAARAGPSHRAAARRRGDRERWAGRGGSDDAYRGGAAPSAVGGCPSRAVAPGAERVGRGAAHPKHYANALRLLVAEQAAEVARVVLIASDVDDMSPEYVEPLRQALTTAGALDVQTWPVQMKKGRAGFRIEAGASEELADGGTAARFPPSPPAG